MQEKRRIIIEKIINLKYILTIADISSLESKMRRHSEKSPLYLLPERVDRSKALPVYQQICDQLRKELVLNGYRRGERFYSYRKLGELYKVELRTVMAALEPLLKDGLLIKRAASGIYVGDAIDKDISLREVGTVWYAVIGEKFSHPFYFNVFEGVEAEAERFGLRVMVGLKKDIRSFERWFRPQPGDGLIISGCCTREYLDAVGARCNDNIIVVGSYDFSGNFGCVTSNYHRAVQKALEMALDAGCRRIGIISNSVKRLISMELYAAADVCRRAHAGVVEDICHVTDPDENGYEAMKRLSDFKPDCVLLTEPAFIGAMEYLQAHGQRCPEDVFIIRYGKEVNDERYLNLAAVNVESDSEILGRNALRMLIANSKDTLRFEMTLSVPSRNK